MRCNHKGFETIYVGKFTIKWCPKCGAIQNFPQSKWRRPKILEYYNGLELAYKLAIHEPKLSKNKMED